MDYLEFIARVTSHIPDKGQVADDARPWGAGVQAGQGEKLVRQEIEEVGLFIF